MSAAHPLADFRLIFIEFFGQVFLLHTALFKYSMNSVNNQK